MKTRRIIVSALASMPLVAGTAAVAAIAALPATGAIAELRKLLYDLKDAGGAVNQELRRVPDSEDENDDDDDDDDVTLQLAGSPAA